ncbi:MAG: hypothetical protein GXO39_02790 [Thermotogae bacterium]|nr:hypothetical protein [Thermotogota bacterium]
MKRERIALLLLRLLWVVLAVSLLSNVGFRIPTKTQVLLDFSYSARTLFTTDTLLALEEKFKKAGFEVKRFGSDTLTDLYTALKGASSPVLLVSDGAHNSSGDPVSLAYDREINILVPKTHSPPPMITHVWMKNPAVLGEKARITVQLSNSEGDTISLRYEGKTYRKWAKDSANFSVPVRRSGLRVEITSSRDTVTFKLYARRPKGLGVVAWSLTPTIRFVRWQIPQAHFLLMREDTVNLKNFSFIVAVDPPHDLIDPNRPSLYVIGRRSAFREMKSKFYLSGKAPPLDILYELPFKPDHVYEKTGRFPLIASKGNALFILSPNIWKVWLADPDAYDRFVRYLQEFLMEDYDIYTEKPLYAPGELLRLFVFPPFPMEVSLNGGKPFRITGMYVLHRRVKKGDTLFIVRTFKKSKPLGSDSIRITLRSTPAEKVYLKVDTTLLGELATISNGIIFNDADSAIAGMRRRSGRNFHLSSLQLLFVLVVLMAWIEWFMRRTRGLI